MAYEFYIDKIPLPVAPSKLQLKIDGTNKTYTLINDGEINVLKAPKLTEVTFDLLLPSVKYPFAVYKDDTFKAPTYYLEKFEKYLAEKKPFQFIVNRRLSNGTFLFGTNMKVSLEDYTIKEDAKEGFDLAVAIKLKQYKEFETKTCSVQFASTKPTATVNKSRSTSNNAPKTGVYYTVKKGDCLWNIAKMYYGNGSKYFAIAEANKGKIKTPNLIYPGQVLFIPEATKVVNMVKTTKESYGLYSTHDNKLLATFTSYDEALSAYNSHGGDVYGTMYIKDMTTGKIVKQKVKGTYKGSGGSKTNAPFTILSSSSSVVKVKIPTWNEAYSYYMINGGSSRGWKIVDKDNNVIAI